jgi:hypothetical protein
MIVRRFGDGIKGNSEGEASGWLHAPNPNLFSNNERHAKDLPSSDPGTA